MRTIPKADSRRLRAVLALGLCCIGGFLAACGSDTSSSTNASNAETEKKSDGPIVIGAAVAKTGVIAQYDTQALQAMQLYIDSVNADGGIEGRQIEMIVEDTHSEIARTPQVAQSLISKGAELMIVSCDFDFGSPAALVAQKAGLVSFTLCATSPKFGVQGIGDKAYDVNVSGGNIGAVMGTYASQEGMKNAYVIVDQGIAAMETQCGAFTDAFEQLGGKVVGTDTFKNSDSSIAPQITQLQKADPDVLVLCSFPPGGAAALRQIRAAGVDIPILSGDGFDGTEWVKAVPDISDLFIVVHASIFGGSDEIDQILADYEAKYDATPTGGFAITGYSTGQTIVEALKQNGGSADGESLMNVLNKFTDFPTANGPVTFTPEVHIQLERPLPIVRFTDGKPEYVETVEPGVEVDLGFGGA